MLKIIHTLALAATVLFASSAVADEFILTLNAPLEGISDGLYQSVKVSPIDAFEVNGVQYVVLEAPNEVNVETLFSVYGTWPISMSVIDGDWSAISAMSPEKKLLNATPVHCRFCLG